MQSLHSFLFVCHILVGAMSLMLFLGAGTIQKRQPGSPQVWPLLQ